MAPPLSKEQLEILNKEFYENLNYFGRDKLFNILRKGIGRFLVTTQQGELYQSSSAFSKVFMKYFEHNVYDLRKAISSKCVSEGNIEEIKKLEHVQGHDLKTILEFYNVYSK